MSTPLSQRDFESSHWLRPDLFEDSRPYSRTDRGRRRQRGSPHDVGGEGLARALGWFSIGLGLAELAAPRALTRWLGVGDHRGLMRVLGARELMSGAGLLSQRVPAGWMWSRVVGDVMDLALLSLALRPSNSRRSNAAMAMGAVAAITLVDLVASQQLTSARRSARFAAEPSARVIPVERSVTVNRSPEECYRFWRELENLPRFMIHLESVRVLDERRSRWTAKAPVGRTVEWDAEIIEDRPNEWIAWRSLEGADVDNSGWVGFHRGPGGRGTVVKVRMQYSPPAGALGALVARLWGEEPNAQVREDLRRFKRIMETGEIPTTEGQPSGRRSRLAQMFHMGSTS